jgi:hypothetical protein
MMANRMLEIATAMNTAAKEKTFSTLYEAFRVFIEIMGDRDKENEIQFKIHNHCPDCGRIHFPDVFEEHPQTTRCHCGLLFIQHSDGHITPDEY